MNAKPPFEVPDGYFENLEKDILAKTTLSHKAIFEANDMPVSSPFTTPKEYFEQSAQNILAKTSQQFPKKVPFHTPNAYFEILQNQIINKINHQKPNIFWLFFQKNILRFNQYLPIFFPTKQVFYSLTFVFFGILGFYFLNNFEKNQNLKNNENILAEKFMLKNNTEKSEKQEIKEKQKIAEIKNNTENSLNLSPQNLSKIITNNQINQASKINENIVQNSKSLNEQLQFISKKDIEEYLKNEEMNTNDLLEIISEEQSAMMVETILLGREEHEEELRHKKEQEINQLLHEIHELEKNGEW